MQTLEPRVFYTHTPYRNQNAIPVFDSSERSLGFNQLFSENRFTGKDRISDSNHLTVAATTRTKPRKRARTAACQRGTSLPLCRSTRHFAGQYLTTRQAFGIGI